jgi:type VI secretion system protein ImpA
MIMTTPSIIDLDALLMPIKDEVQAGQNVRHGSTYRALKEAKRQEDAITDGPMQRPGKNPDWQKVILLATKILTEEAKDLEVLVWLAEGLTRKQGFSGLRDGLKALALAHDKCWTNLFPPVVEEGDLDGRATRLEALNTILPAAIRVVPIIQQSGGISYSCYDYEKGHEEVETIKAEVQAAKSEEQRGYAKSALDEARKLGEKIDNAVTAVPLSHFLALRDLICQAWDAFQALDRSATEKYGAEGFTLRPLREVLESCRDLLDALVRKKGGMGLRAEGTDEPKHKEHTVTTTSAEEVPLSGEVRSRKEALEQLQNVADFFRRTEPHSPVSYLVQRAARWGQMPLAEWLQEVIKNAEVLGEVKETLGLAKDSTTTSTDS